MTNKVTFPSRDSKDFYLVLKQQIDLFFKEKNISEKATLFLVTQNILALLAFITCYSFLFLGILHGAALIGCFALTGIFATVFSFNIAHDIIHGAYFKNQKLNRWGAYIFDIFGPSSARWRYSHNYMHHNYPNVPGFDPDLDQSFLLRYDQKAPLKTWHRFQHLYSTLLYVFAVMSWVYFTDIRWCFSKKCTINNAITTGTFKIIHAAIFMIFPLLWAPAPVTHVLFGIFILYTASGLLSAAILLPGHITDKMEFPGPDEGAIHTPWVVHVLNTTSDYATANPLICWLTGGLNYQVVHHLFPYISHIHYPALTKILKKVAHERGLPYHLHATWLEGIKAHFVHLKRNGTHQQPINEIIEN